VLFVVLTMIHLDDSLYILMAEKGASMLYTTSIIQSRKRIRWRLNKR